MSAPSPENTHSLVVALHDLHPSYLADIVTKSTFAALLQTAQSLPDICWAGLEIRLAADQAEVDLSQRITAQFGEAGKLANHLGQHWQAANHAQNPAWQRLLNFLQSWSVGELRAQIPVLWFESDGATPDTPPSVFFTPDRGFFTPNASDTTQSEQRAVAYKALTKLLSPAQKTAVTPHLDQCFDSCRGRGKITQIGVMLSRETETLRICAEGLATDDFAEVLRANSQGLTTEATDFVHWIIAKNGRINMLDFDIGPNATNSIGVEVSFEGQPDEAAKWAVFLQDLEQLGLCSSEKRAALANWRGTLCLNSIAASTQPWDQRHLKLQISHIKLVFKPDQPVSAKAYLMFGETS